MGNDKESSDYSSSPSNDFKNIIDTTFKYSVYTKKFDSIMRSKKRSLCAPPAPPEGLYLAKIIY